MGGGRKGVGGGDAVPLIIKSLTIKVLNARKSRNKLHKMWSNFRNDKGLLDKLEMGKNYYYFYYFVQER